MSHNYHERRLNHPTVKFSLMCRARAISQAMKENSITNITMTLDIGSADGLLAYEIRAGGMDLGQIQALDLDFELLKHNPFLPVQGDCTRMPFADGSFDVITAAALIEHLPDPNAFLHECRRVLRTGGALFLTSPVPFFEWLATKIGYLKDSGHVARYSISGLKSMCAEAGLSPTLAHKFMPSPIGFPGYRRIERAMQRTGLDFLMLNQIVACKKLEG